MSAQEFSSPGAHMASMSGGSSSSSAPSSVIYAPRRSTGYGPGESSMPSINYNSINRGYERGELSDFISSAYDMSERYNEKYMRYNSNLFNTAMDYDKYMSNTAIQRQVEDLKKAGLNPVLAARLGGATYKGVNAPYLQISPSSALNSFLDFGASTYATDTQARTSIETQKMQNDSQQFIASYNKVMDRLIAGDKFVYDSDLIELQRDADMLLLNVKRLDNEHLQMLGFENEKALINYKNEMDKNFQHYMALGSDEKVPFLDEFLMGFYGAVRNLSGVIQAGGRALAGGNTYNFN